MYILTFYRKSDFSNLIPIYNERNRLKGGKKGETNKQTKSLIFGIVSPIRGFSSLNYNLSLETWKNHYRNAAWSYAARKRSALSRLLSPIFGKRSVDTPEPASGTFVLRLVFAVSRVERPVEGEASRFRRNTDRLL